MRIIYGKDYYDNALAYGRDESIVFVRSKSDLRTDGEMHDHAISGNRAVLKGVTYIFERIIVYFCGKVYHGIRTKTSSYTRDFPTWKEDVTFFWNIDNFKEWLVNTKIPQFKATAENKRDRYIYTTNYKEKTTWMIENKIVVAVRFPEVIGMSTNKTYDWRPDFDSQHWKVNSDNLKSVQFYKVFDAYTAFQEISMWIGGVLALPANPMVEIDDKIRIEKHGFDKIKSFRNMN